MVELARKLSREHPSLRANFLSYRIPVMQVSGELADIIDVFVRINSTGKPLTSGSETARPLLHQSFSWEAERLVRKFRTPYA